VSGRIVATGSQRHKCAPGWSTEFSDGPPFGPGLYAIPPDAGEYRKGTVWQCDDCGRTWVSTGPIAPNSPGFIDFRREKRRERKRRERRAERSQP
jgi:hypothetical protein